MKKYSIKQLFVFLSIIFINIDIAFANSPIREYFVTPVTSTLQIDTATNTVYGILMWLGYAIAVCIIIVTGIQFLTAGTQKKAMLKEKLWLIFLGVFILVAGSSILAIFMNVIEDSI